jgi:hypothetical protein
MMRRLAAGEHVNDADLDWPNIAEEIETVGRSERAVLRSRILDVIEHLMRLQSSPATEPRLGGRKPTTALVQRSRTRSTTAPDCAQRSADL